VRGEIVSRRSVVVLLIKGSTMANPKGGKAPPDGMSIAARNVVGVTAQAARTPVSKWWLM
jgi:hypothetical protein